MNTTHPFGHFHITDFFKTWQEYVNSCAGEIKKNPLRGCFCPKTGFLIVSVNFKNGYMLKNAYKAKAHPCRVLC